MKNKLGYVRPNKIASWSYWYWRNPCHIIIDYKLLKINIRNKTHNWFWQKPSLLKFSFKKLARLYINHNSSIPQIIQSYFFFHRLCQKVMDWRLTKARNAASANTSVPSAKGSGCPATAGRTWARSASNAESTSSHTNR